MKSEIFPMFRRGDIDEGIKSFLTLLEIFSPETLKELPSDAIRQLCALLLSREILPQVASITLIAEPSMPRKDTARFWPSMG